MLALHKCSLVTVVYFITYFTCVLAQLVYVGCYRDAHMGTRALPQHTYDGGSPQICQSYCQFNSLYTYFSTQYQYECFCGETYDLHGPVVDNSECNLICSRDLSQKCGGPDRNSVYYVCPRGSFGPVCNQTCHCKDREFCDRNGTCLRGVGCEKGWDGDTCSHDIDECATTNGQCEHVCNNTVGGYFCYCLGNQILSGDGYSCNDPTANAWKTACIVMACNLCVVLVLLLIYILVRVYRWKSTPDRDKISNVAPQLSLQYEHIKATGSTGGFKNHTEVKPTKENKLTEKEARSSPRQHTEDNRSENETYEMYQEIKPVKEFDQIYCIITDT